MSMYRRRRCCCGGPCPCAVSDDFEADSIADYDVVGTFAVAGGVLSATTSGTATQTLKLPMPGSSKAAGVKADVIDNSHALFGLTIGIGDNRLEWQWDVAGTQCTFTAISGGSSIASESYAGAPVTSLEIQIVPSGCAWDVTLYRDGVLVDTHLAVAVTFEEDWMPFGVVADASGGTWDNLCLRNCYGPLSCVKGCLSANVPIAWKLDASGLSDNASFDDGTTDTERACSLFNGSWTLLNWTRQSSTLFSGVSEIDCVGCPDQTPYYTQTGALHFGDCTFWAVDPDDWSLPDEASNLPFAADDPCLPDYYTCAEWSPSHGTGDTSNPLGHTNPVELPPLPKSPVQLLEADPTVRRTGLYAWAYPNTFGGAVDSSVLGRLLYEGGEEGPLWRMSIQSVTPTTVKLTATAHRKRWGPGAGPTDSMVAAYESAPIDVTDPNAIIDGGPVTLTYTTAGYPIEDDAEGDFVCTAPSTITMAPMSGAEIVTTGLLAGSDGCDDAPGCNPLYSEHGLLSLDGSLLGEDFRACLSGDPGYSQGPFTGIIGGLTGSCASETIGATLECKRVCTHQYQWVLTLTDGTNVNEIPCDPENIHNVAIVVSSPVTFTCGSGAFAALLGDFAPTEEDDHPFICACPELNIGLLCANAERWHIAAELLEDFPGSCPGWPGACTVDEGFLDLTNGPILCGGVPIAPAGFDDSKNYFRGPIPANDSFGSFTDWELVVFCDGGVLKFFNLDASNCVVGGVGTIAAWDCESFTGHIDWQTVSDDCCGSLGSGTIRLALG